MHPLDAALVASCPTIPVPRYGKFCELEQIGHRLLVASDGLWFEAKRPWLHLIWPLGQGVPIAIPYGELAASLTLAFKVIDPQLLTQFLKESRQCYPLEHAAWFVWDEIAQALNYCELPANQSTTDCVESRRPLLPDHQHLCIDIHSHGQYPAFFSETDDADDRGEFKLAIVLGNVMDEQPSIAARLCAGGMYSPLTTDVLGGWHA